MKKDDEQSAKEILLEKILDEQICLLTLTMVSYGEMHIEYAQACYKMAEFYLEYKNLPKQAEKHCQNGFNTMKNVKENKTSSDNECNKVYMALYYLKGRISTILKRLALDKLFISWFY